jgi:hypothetical protein
MLVKISPNGSGFSDFRSPQKKYYNMENFNAKEAKNIADLKRNKLHQILLLIKKEAESGEYVLRVYEKLDNNIIESLETIGFRVENLKNTTTGIYHGIWWS